jgi:hypothetical protein
MTNQPESNPQEQCLSCQHEAHWKLTGSFASQEARNHWSLFGCTCEPEAAEEADAYVRLIAD